MLINDVWHTLGWSNFCLIQTDLDQKNEFWENENPNESRYK